METKDLPLCLKIQFKVDDLPSCLSLYGQIWHCVIYKQKKTWIKLKKQRLKKNIFKKGKRMSKCREGIMQDYY